MKFLKVTTFLFLIHLSFQSVAGGWPQKKGKGYFKIGQFILIANKYYNPEGNRISVEPRISLFTTSLYGEYGLTDRITIVGYVPFFTRSILNDLEKRGTGEIVEGNKLTSFGDTDIGLKFGLITNKKIVLSTTIIFGIPFGNAGGPETSLLQTGDGEFNQKLTLEASTSFYPAPIYASVSVGFNHRTKDFSEEFHYGLEIGYTFQNLTAIAKLAGVESFMNGTTDANSEQGVFGNNIEFLMFSPELVYEIIPKKMGVTANASIPLSGRQILANTAYSAGVYLKI